VARLFSALYPPDDARADLAEALMEALTQAPGEPDGRLRWAPPRRWHVTLGFFGDDDDPHRRIRWLRRRLAGRSAPTLRIAGSGTFPGVFWVGIEPAGPSDQVCLATLAQAAGAGRRGYHPHLTLARWNPRQRAGRGEQGRGKPAVQDLLAGYNGPWFTPGEVLLVRSDLGASGPTYQTIERVPLSGA
jgi:2'-5' RNA ligase